jgi:hypothetical protein
LSVQYYMNNLIANTIHTLKEKTCIVLFKDESQRWAPVAHICNPIYLGGWDPEDCNLRPVQANISWDLMSKITRAAGHWWFTPVILATQEAEMRRIAVWSQAGQIAHETLSQKNPSQKKGGGTGRVAQVIRALT